MALSRDFLQARITATETQIDAMEVAILAITSGAVEEYRIDTGQTITHVTRSNVGTLQKSLDVLYNRLSIMCARLDGGNTIQVRPAF